MIPRHPPHYSDSDFTHIYNLEAVKIIRAPTNTAFPMTYIPMPADSPLSFAKKSNPTECRIIKPPARQNINAKHADIIANFFIFLLVNLVNLRYTDDPLILYQKHHAYARCFWFFAVLCFVSFYNLGSLPHVKFFLGH